jgi:RNA polymerase sigma factor (sigma-70 family)
MSVMTEDPRALDIDSSEPVARGYDESFDAMFATAYRVAYRILGSRDAASDVASETLAKAWLSWGRIHGYAAAWVARVSANTALSVVRRRDVRERLRLSRARQPVDHVELRHDLVRALRKLPERQRQVLVLRYLADLPELEVAVALGCSVGTVKQHAHRALRALRSDTDLNEET